MAYVIIQYEFKNWFYKNLKILSVYVISLLESFEYWHIEFKFFWYNIFRNSDTIVKIWTKSFIFLLK